MASYAEDALEALETLREDGQAMTLEVPAAGAALIDPDTGLPVTPAPVATTYTVYGIAIPVTYHSIKESLERESVPGSMTREEVRSFLIAASGLAVVPASPMRLVVNGETWQILGSDPIIPTGEAIVYTVVAKR